MANRRIVAAPVVLVLVLGLLSVGRPVAADLSAAEWKATLEKIDVAVKAQDAGKAAAGLREAAKDDSERAAKLAVLVLAKLPDAPEVYAAVEEAAITFTKDKALETLRKEALAQKDWTVRVQLVDALAARGARETDTIAKATKDKEEKVQVAAIRALASFKTIAATEAIIACMEKVDEKGPQARGVVWQDAKHALKRLLGNADLDSGVEYRSWLEAHRDKFREGIGITVVERGEGERGKGDGGGGEGGIKTEIFGLEIACKKVVIVLDVSGSMEAADPYPPGAGTVARGGGDGSNDPERRRIVRAKKELVKVLKGLSESKAKVNVVAYSTDVIFWRPEGLHALGGEALRSATEFVEAFKADGVTCTDTAILMAIEQCPDADCIYLLSDGFTTHDGETKVPTPEILAAVEEANRVRKIQINTLGFVGADRELMQELAAATGGTYADIE